MKREILFRGKSPKGHWIYGMPSYDLNYIFNDSNYDSYEQFEVIPETIGQFTGLNDKNGVKIFERDKIRGISNNPFSIRQCREYAVIWGIDHWHIEYTHFTLQELFNYCNNNIEIIGNIHDK